MEQEDCLVSFETNSKSLLFHLFGFVFASGVLFSSFLISRSVLFCDKAYCFTYGPEKIFRELQTSIGANQYIPLDNILLPF